MPSRSVYAAPEGPASALAVPVTDAEAGDPLRHEGDTRTASPGSRTPFSFDVPAPNDTTSTVRPIGSSPAIPAVQAPGVWTFVTATSSIHQLSPVVVPSVETRKRSLTVCPA